MKNTTAQMIDREIMGGFGLVVETRRFYQPCATKPLSFFTGEAQMNRKYVVEQWFNRWVVFVEYSNGSGVFARKWAGAYASKHLADKFADRGDYIQLKAARQFHKINEMAGAR
jgi:hypothetical protein